MYSPKVSVIVPNYNHGKFLRERVDSILNQTFTDFELIVLDDASTDDSVSVLQSIDFQSKLSHFIINDCNSGSTFRQWKKGFELCKGELIWIAESDDIAHPEFLEKLALFFEHSSVVFSFCNSSIIDADSRVTAYHNEWIEAVSTEKWKTDFVENGHTFLTHFQRYRNVVSNASSAVFRKDVLKSIDFDYEAFRYCGDWKFWNELCLLGAVGFSASTLNFWRQHDATTRSIADLKKDYDRMEENKRVISEINRQIATPIDKEKYTWLLTWWMSRFSYRNLVRLNFLFPPLPAFLYLKFYSGLFIRTCSSIFTSIKNKFK